MPQLKTYARSSVLLERNKASEYTHKKNWKWQSSDYLCQELAEKTDTVLLAFSLGKDSVAAYLQLKRFFRNVHLYYYYIAPGIPFIDASVRYYEDVFGQKIVQVPSASFLENVNDLLFLDVNTALIVNELRQDLPTFLKNSHSEMNDILSTYAKSLLNIPLDTITADGNRADDNSMRRTSLIMHSPFSKNRNHFRPIYDWSKKEVLQVIKDANIKLPIDYRIWGRSFDGIDYKFTKGLKDNLPNSYEYLRSWYPCIDLELKKYENFSQHKFRAK